MIFWVSWFQHNFFFFPRYGFPWLLVMVTRNVFMSYVDESEWTHPSRVKVLCFFGRHFPPNVQISREFGEWHKAFIISSGPKGSAVVSSGFLPHTCGCYQSRISFLCFSHSRLRWRHRRFNKESHVTIGLWSQVIIPLDLGIFSFLFFNVERVLQEVCMLCRIKNC